MHSVAEIAKTVSNGALMGARGNSGVILSQIFRGFSQGVGKKEALDANDFAIAMRRGVDLAYKAVMRPVEGTILTVCKHMALAASAAATEGADIIGLLERVLAEGQKALDNTPNQLPVLKQAGVVDAGGKGLLTIFEGGYRRLLGEEFSYEEGEAKASAAPKEAGIGTEGLETASIQYPYCTELIVKGKNIPLEKIQAFLKDKGDSQVAVGDASLVKIHIHTKDPGAIFSYMLQFGTLHNMKIDNMQEQYETKAQAETDEKPVNGGAVYGEGLEDCRCAVVTVSSGDGIKDIFLELGAACIINGGQSMNPSAEDILNAINQLPAEEIVVLPNNSNIILTAQQAQKMAKKNVSIVPTKFVTQGITAMLAFDPEQGATANADAMVENFANVKSGEVTYAVRDSHFEDNDIKEGDILGLYNGKISQVGKDLDKVVLNLLQDMVAETDGLVTLLYGENLKADAAEAIAQQVREAYPDLEIGLEYGGQALYYFLIAVE